MRQTNAWRHVELTCTTGIMNKAASLTVIISSSSVGRFFADWRLLQWNMRCRHWPLCSGYKAMILWPRTRVAAYNEQLDKNDNLLWAFYGSSGVLSTTSRVRRRGTCLLCSSSPRTLDFLVFSVEGPSKFYCTDMPLTSHRPAAVAELANVQWQVQSISRCFIIHLERDIRLHSVDSLLGWKT